ncbi:MAG: VWA domain-containing protein [Prevotella sp.]|nr:VWA domain-containing protein [Prevotella sp.]
MKKVLLLLFLCTYSLVAYNQVLKERRVYYLDCSYSMEANGIWNDVRDNLKKAIDNVVDETTELIVIPFADNTSPNPTLKPMKEFATSAGKKKLKSQIDALSMNKNTMTYHYIPIEDFYNNRVDNNRVTYMFLMTDGQDEDKQQKALKQLLPQWGAKFGDKNVYGFYVMLHKMATNPKIDDVANKQDHLWKVETADVNINLIRLQSSAIFNAKNDKYFDLPIFGDASGKSFEAAFPSNCPYKVKKSDRISNSLRIWVESIPGQKLPVSTNYTLHIEMKGGGKFDFLVTENVSVKCEYKPERSLKISVR